MCLGHELKANTCRNSTVEKNSPTSGPPVSIEPTLSDAVKAQVRFLPEDLSTVPDMCTISTRDYGTFTLQKFEQRQSNDWIGKAG